MVADGIFFILIKYLDINLYYLVNVYIFNNPRLKLKGVLVFDFQGWVVQMMSSHLAGCGPAKLIFTLLCQWLIIH